MSELYVRPRWDSEAKVFYTESNVRGLHVEAATLEEYWETVEPALVGLYGAELPYIERRPL